LGPRSCLLPDWLHFLAFFAFGRGAASNRIMAFASLEAVLADALLDAGCQDAELLTHLRAEGPHWPGCWAVDCLLGKS